MREGSKNKTKVHFVLRVIFAFFFLFFFVLFLFDLLASFAFFVFFVLFLFFLTSHAFAFATSGPWPVNFCLIFTCAFATSHASHASGQGQQRQQGKQMFK